MIMQWTHHARILKRCDISPIIASDVRFRHRDVPFWHLGSLGPISVIRRREEVHVHRRELCHKSSDVGLAGSAKSLVKTGQSVKDKA